MSKSRRNQIITDESVQGELLFRAMVYWFFCLAVIQFFVFGWSFWTGPVRPLSVVLRDSIVSSAPAIFGSVVLLPVVLVDVLRVSNRFVGPIQQVRHTMRQLATGEPARRVYLRRDDFWHDLANYTNMVADDLELVREVEDEDFDVEEDIPCTDELENKQAAGV